MHNRAFSPPDNPSSDVCCTERGIPSCFVIRNILSSVTLGETLWSHSTAVVGPESVSAASWSNTNASTSSATRRSPAGIAFVAPATARSSELLPIPLGPTMRRRSPRQTSKLTPCNKTGGRRDSLLVCAAPSLARYVAWAPALTSAPRNSTIICSSSSPSEAKRKRDGAFLASAGG